MSRTGKMFRGKRVIDSKVPMNLIVREDDVKNAKRKNPEACVLARCAMRDKHVDSARIGKMFALVEFRSHYERFYITKTTREMVQDFDERGTFVQGHYELAPIPKSLKLSGHSRDDKKRSHGKRGKRLNERMCQRNIFRAAEV